MEILMVSTEPVFFSYTICRFEKTVTALTETFSKYINLLFILFKSIYLSTHESRKGHNQ